jgi:hypothetical protein
MKLIKFNNYDVNKKNILVNYTLAFSSNFCNHSSKIYIDFFNEYKEYNFILFGCIKKLKYFEKYALEFKRFSGVLYNEIDINVNTWVEFLDNIDTNLPIKFEKIIEIGGLLNTNFYSGIEIALDNLLLEKYSKSYTKFLSIRNNIILCFLIILLAKNNKLPISHLIYDPEVCDYSKFKIMENVKYKRFFLYNSILFNFNRLDNISYYYNHNKVKYHFLFDNKNYDLVTGFSILTKNRKYFEKYNLLFNKVNNKKVFVKDKYKDINTFVNKEQYLTILNDSYTTLILPSYEKKSFSYIRFIESIASNCIPLIHSDCYIEEAFSEFEKINFINLLIVNENNINDKINFIKLNFNSIIQELKKYYIEKKDFELII